MHAPIVCYPITASLDSQGQLNALLMLPHCEWNFTHDKSSSNNWSQLVGHRCVPFFRHNSQVIALRMRMLRVSRDHTHVNTTVYSWYASKGWLNSAKTVKSYFEIKKICFYIYVYLSPVELCSRIGDLPTLFNISSRIFIKITRKFIFIATVITLCFRTLKIIISVKNRGVRKQRVPKNLSLCI